jgi:hypothetical protein
VLRAAPGDGGSHSGSQARRATGPARDGDGGSSKPPSLAEGRVVKETVVEHDRKLAAPHAEADLLLVELTRSCPSRDSETTETYRPHCRSLRWTALDSPRQDPPTEN